VSDAESKVTLRPRSKLERILDGLEDSYGVPARPNLDLTTQVALLLLVGAGADGRTAVAAIKPLCAKGGAVDASKLAATARDLLAPLQDTPQLDDTVAALRALGDAALASPSLEDRCRADPADARRALRMLGLGEQRADLVLLQAGLHPLVAPSASAMQVAIRVGYPGTGYGTFARVLDQELPEQYAIAVAWRAHHLLDQHGKSLCTIKTPQCARCPIRDACAFRGEGEDPAGRLSWRAPPADS
jgi:endonuclease III